MIVVKSFFKNPNLSDIDLKPRGKYLHLRAFEGLVDWSLLEEVSQVVGLQKSLTLFFSKSTKASFPAIDDQFGDDA